MNAFIISLVMSFVGLQLKILRISWYTSMEPFQTNLDLVINKCLYSCHASSPGFDSYSNDQIIIGMSKYIYSYNYIPIWFELFIHF